MSLTKLEQITLYRRLPENVQQWLASLACAHRFSLQQLRYLVDYSLDMVCWNQDKSDQDKSDQDGSDTKGLEKAGLHRFYRPEACAHLKGKQAGAAVFSQLKTGYETVKHQLKSYPDTSRFTAAERKFPAAQMVETTLHGDIMGRCPVASEKTRCCNLNTLDAVQQCGFDCSYCSIQSFYHGDQVRFVRDLAAHIDRLDIDRDAAMHIGTGQSSDSLMWGNRFGLLDTLTRFAADHPRVVLEMKSKSARIDYFLENPPPCNMVFTWSLNTPPVIAAEEKGTASLEQRLASARTLADRGIPVGFHFHPMVWYQGWQRDYTDIVRRLTALFSPEQVVMVSLGTLTFIRPVIKRIRERMAQTSILRMPMEECAGKLSYPFDIKKELFSTLYQAFPASWHDQVFFYMCMEDVDLWAPVFERTYPSNEAFEQDMLDTYLAKIRAIRNKSNV